MVKEFFSIHVNETTGEEIQLEDFSVFENLSIVTDDRVNVDDLIFLFKSIKLVKEKILKKLVMLMIIFT